MKLSRWFTAVAVTASLSLPTMATAQVEEALERVGEVIEKVTRPARPPVAAPGAKPEVPKKEGEAEPEPVPSKPKPDLPPRYMVLRLQDGSTITGELSVNEIKVKTEFGELTVPINRIRSFTPGLESNSRAGEELKAKLKELESDDYKTREQAHKDLAAMGAKISKQIAPYATSDNAEVKRHVTEILKEFEQQAEDSADDDETPNKAVKAWINEDTIETADFTVIGKIAPEEFELKSKYGPLTVALGEIRVADRPVETKESTRKSLSVAGQSLAIRGFKPSGIRVQAGDRITITATGSITMSPWGSNAQSGPDGMPNYGWYIPGQIPNGALCGKIGDKGTPFKIGSKYTVVAKSAGTLQLAVGMMQEYSNEGYNFPGDFKVKIKVDPQ